MKKNNTKYLKKRTRALIECLRAAEKKKENGNLVRKGNEDRGSKDGRDSIYTIAARAAKKRSAGKMLSADLTHRLETEYPEVSAAVFTHNGI